MNNADAKKSCFRFSLRALILWVAFVCLIANLWLNYKAAFTTPRLYSRVMVEAKQLDMAGEMFRDYNPGSIVLPNGLDNQEKLVYLLGGRYDGSIYFEFTREQLVDHDRDTFFEYEALNPNYNFANIEGSIVVWNRFTRQSYDVDTFLKNRMQRNRFSPLSPIVSFAIFLIVAWFTLPQFCSKLEVFVSVTFLAALLYPLF